MFALGTEGLKLVEVAAGIDVERELLAQMAFRPQIAPFGELKTMDPRIACPSRCSCSPRCSTCSSPTG